MLVSLLIQQEVVVHKVLLMIKVKIFRYCSTINFSEDYWRQQYLNLGSTPMND